MNVISVKSVYHLLIQISCVELSNAVWIMDGRHASVSHSCTAPCLHELRTYINVLMASGTNSCIPSGLNVGFIQVQYCFVKYPLSWRHYTQHHFEVMYSRRDKCKSLENFCVRPTVCLATMYQLLSL
jgi:hypothetical protein